MRCGGGIVAMYTQCTPKTAAGNHCCFGCFFVGRIKRVWFCFVTEIRFYAENTGTLNDFAAQIANILSDRKCRKRGRLRHCMTAGQGCIILFHSVTAGEDGRF